MGSRSNYLGPHGERNKWTFRCNSRAMVEERVAIWHERAHETKFLVLAPRLGRKKRKKKRRKS